MAADFRALEERANDGLVSLVSARWGKYVETLVGVNHWEIKRCGSGKFLDNSPEYSLYLFTGRGDQRNGAPVTERLSNADAEQADTMTRVYNFFAGTRSSMYEWCVAWASFLAGACRNPFVLTTATGKLDDTKDVQREKKSSALNRQSSNMIPISFSRSSKKETVQFC